MPIGRRVEADREAYTGDNRRCCQARRGTLSSRGLRQSHMDLRWALGVPMPLIALSRIAWPGGYVEREGEATRLQPGHCCSRKCRTSPDQQRQHPARTSRVPFDHPRRLRWTRTPLLARTGACSAASDLAPAKYSALMRGVPLLARADHGIDHLRNKQRHLLCSTGQVIPPQRSHERHHACEHTSVGTDDVSCAGGPAGDRGSTAEDHRPQTRHPSRRTHRRERPSGSANAAPPPQRKPPR